MLRRGGAFYRKGDEFNNPIWKKRPCPKGQQKVTLGDLKPHWVPDGHNSLILEIRKIESRRKESPK